MRKGVVFDFGEWEITVRELIAAPTILGIMLVLGFVIGGKIDNAVQAKNLMYHSAPHVETVEAFKDRLETDNRHIFSSGHMAAVWPVNFANMYTNDYPEGDYLYVSVHREEYRRHEEHWTDDDGNHHVRVYYSWDADGSKERWAPAVVFNDCPFPTAKFDFKVPRKYLGCRGGGLLVGSHRYKYYCLLKDYDGIVFTKIENKDIFNAEFYTEFGMDIDALEEDLTTSHAVQLFWSLWIVLTIALIIIFFYADNYWLE